MYEGGTWKVESRLLTHDQALEALLPFLFIGCSSSVLLLPFTPPEDDALLCCCSTLLLSDSFPPSKQQYRRDSEKSLRSRVAHCPPEKTHACQCYYFTMLCALVLFELTDFLVKTLLPSHREVKAMKYYACAILDHFFTSCITAGSLQLMRHTSLLKYLPNSECLQQKSAF